MTFDELLSRLRQNNVNLWVEGERLRYKGSQDVMNVELLEQIRKYKFEIIAFLKKADAYRESSLPEIRADLRPGKNLPLSFAQEPLWFLHQLQPKNTSDHLTVGFRVSGALNIPAFEKSLNEIIQRHEILRTTFPEVDGQPVQVIHSTSSLKVSVVDLAKLPDSDREFKIQKHAVEEGRKPFNLTRDLLLRSKLLRIRENEHVLFLTMHHIISDGWSFDLLYHELEQLYETFSSAIPSTLEELPVQYADYVCWHRQWMQEQALEPHVAYWKKQLAGSSLVLELPADRPRPAVQSYRGAKRFMEFSNDLLEGIKALSQREGCTFFMVLMAAFQILLYRYTEKDDIIVGVPVANRNQPELQKLIGLFLNMIVLRTDLSANPNFRSFLARVREVTLGAFAHQDLPFEKLVEVLRPDRDLSRNPLFQVMFQYSPQGCLKFPGLSAEAIHFDSGTAQFDLSLHLYDIEAGLLGFFEYNTDLFDSSTIDRMAKHFLTLLASIVENPDQPLSELSLLNAAEKQQLLVEWNDTVMDYPNKACLHQLFEAQVARTPDRVAVLFEENQLTYAELNRRANQLAHHLQTLGVGPDVLVGICVERSLDMMVALLGVLKAGGAYVPLDPAFPTERLTLMLDDARVAVLLAQEDLIGILPETHGAVLCLDRDWERVAQHSESEPISEVRADHLAYVIYTSGSTGKPKGVQISHQALVNFLFSMMKEPGLAEQDVLLAVTTLSFDISMLELFLPIITGARVVIVSSEDALDGDCLLSRLTTSGATVMQATPATWRLLLGTEWEGSDQLKILCGGEALPRDLATQLLERCDSLWNMYGPTETTIWSTVDKIDNEEAPVLIGFPIANTQVYILDRHLQPAPVGVPGELHIGGDGLARGYLNRPELTAERFIANPFSDLSGSRLYKTGDLAKYLPDGNIEVLGRLDFQVKVRGFRIELGEIESALNHHPGVRQAATIVREDVPGDKQLVAYLIANNHQAPKVDILRNFLKGKLPEYMIPSSFVVMEQLPLTPNGKVDRKALPPPSGVRPDLDLAYLAPRTELEQTITTIWQKVLQIDNIGIEDNFFDLGGHSLRMARVHSKLRNKVQIDISMVVMFQYPTISSLAQYLSQDDMARDAYQPADERTEKLLEGKNRLKKRFKQRVQADR